MVKVQVSAIVVPATRFRQEAGDLRELKESLQQVGLIQPLTVVQDGDRYILVTGARRLQAAKELGWTEIEAVLQGYDEIDRQLAEIDENLKRTDLTWEEKGKALKKREELIAAKVGRFSPATQPREEGSGRFTGVYKPLAIDGQRYLKGDESGSEKQTKEEGEPQGPASHRELSKQTGIPRRTVDTNVKAVTFLERYPALSKVVNKKGTKDLYKIIALGKLREGGKIDDAQLEKVVARANEGLPPELAASLVKLEAASPEKATEVLEKWKKGYPAKGLAETAETILYNLSKPQMYPGKGPSFTGVGAALGIGREYRVLLPRPDFVEAVEDAAKKEGLAVEKFIASCVLDYMVRKHHFREEVADDIRKRLI